MKKLLLICLLILTSCDETRGKKGDVVLEMQSKVTLKWKPVALHFGGSDQEFNYNFCMEHLKLLKTKTSYRHRCVPIK